MKGDVGMVTIKEPRKVFMEPRDGCLKMVHNSCII